MCLSAAPHVEFTKPLHDVEVREKESARFECEVSRENIKVRTSDIQLKHSGDILVHIFICFHRSAGSETEVKSGKARSMKSLLKVASTSSSSTSPCLTMRQSTSVMLKLPSLLGCSRSLVRILTTTFDSRISAFGDLASP